MSEGHDLLEGGGAPVFKYERPGFRLSGTIVEYSQRDQTKPGGEVVRWPDGRAKREAVITVLQADGERRRDYVRGNKLHGLRLAWAELSGVESPIGLHYDCERVEDRPPTQPGYSPSHQFKVKLTRTDANPDDLA